MRSRSAADFLSTCTANMEIITYVRPACSGTRDTWGSEGISAPVTPVISAGRGIRHASSTKGATSQLYQILDLPRNRVGEPRWHQSFREQRPFLSICGPRQRYGEDEDARKFEATRACSS